MNSHMTVTRKKLIEVALPLEAINKASAREKSIRHGHPSTLHLWWARRPLAAARAVIFSQLVDDPSSYVDTLLGDPATKRAAERELKKRRELWGKRKAEFAAATGKEAVAVPEPGLEPTLEDCAADIERQRLFRIIEELVLWENTTNEAVLEQARAEIWQSWRRACADNADHPRAKELFDRNKLPAFHDPFAGGGALPLEAQRLGLQAYASDLNPVAVLINKAMIGIPPKFAGRPPVNPEARAKKDLISRQWKGAEGLAEDVRYYGKWMRDEAEKRIGHLYPKVEITAEMAMERPDLKPLVGQKLTVIAWLWARTVKSPNPAFGEVDVPLVSSFMLSPMVDREVFIEPVVEGSSYRFSIKVGKPVDAGTVKLGTKLGRGANFRCLMSGTPIAPGYIKSEGAAGRLGARMMAIVAEGDRRRIYLAPTAEMEGIAQGARPEWMPDVAISGSTQYLGIKPYGMKSFSQLFTNRQLVALTTFSELARTARDRAFRDALAENRPNNSENEGSFDKVTAGTYADAVALYLSFLLSKLADKGATLCTWDVGPTSSRTASGRSARVATVSHVFSRQALPMTWDFAEVNFFSSSVGSLETVLRTLTIPLEYLPYNARAGVAQQLDATVGRKSSSGSVISTDPPYYDNVPYADLSDFFYVWLRYSLQAVFPDLFATVAVPKAQELVAFAYRHDGKAGAEAFFLKGMTQAMHRLAEETHPVFPATIYYAFRQSETDEKEGTISTGWDTFLDAVLRAGFGISGTWPMRTEYTGNLKKNRNALASSIILVCRPRTADALPITRRDFLTQLKAELPAALAHLQRSNIAPVDLAQSAIGPGMAVFTRYAKVVDAEGKALTVREALALINQTLDEVLAEQEGDFDADTRWAVAWFEQMGFNEGDFGTADVLARAKVTAVSGLVEAGIVESGRGKVRLLKPVELTRDWDPAADVRLTVWEIVHHLIRVLEAGGENAAAILLVKIGARAEIARELAYRLYTVCERKKRAAEALSYNGLVQSWPEISRLARASVAAVAGEPAQPEMFGTG